jgi:hypothetical protein
MTATEWAVTLEAALPGPLPADATDDLCGFLESNGGAVSLDDHSIEATLTVSAEDPFEAAWEARHVLEKGLIHVGVPPTGWLSVEVLTTDEQDRRIVEPTIPELVGVAEVAQLLDVSKQRVSELTHSAGFPAPVVRLASGPVWARSTLERFVENWRRRPGRPGIASC